MGNEQSTHKGLTQNGKVPEKHENGSANGVTANITSTGIEIDARGDTTIIQNNEPFSLDLATESTEPDFVVVESEPAKAEVISEIPEIPEIPEAPVQMAEVKKSKSQKTSVFGKMFKTKTEAPADVKKVQQTETSNEDVTDEGPPAADPQPELNPREEAAITSVIENPEQVGHPQRADTSTQTDRTTEVDIATQTDEDEDTTVKSSESPAEEEAAIESVMTEESLDQSVIIAEEAVEETANEEASESPTVAIIGDEVVVVTENDAFENSMFRAELVVVTDNFETSPCNPEDESFNGLEETEPEIATEPESDPNRSTTEEEDTTVSLEVSSGLPKVVADCIELVFSAVPESIDLVELDEEITEEMAVEVGDMSADVALIETTEPEADVITPEPEEENGAPSLYEEIVTLVMETICEVTHEDTNPENQNTSGELLPVLTKTVILVMEESAHVNVTTDYAVAPETSQTDELSPVIDDEPSEKCDEEETVISELISTEELPEDEVEPETTPDVITSGENAEISEELTPDVGPETVDESQPSPAVVCEDDEMIPEAAIDVLAQEFVVAVPEPQEPAADNENLVEEEVIAATVFMPLSAEQELSLTAPEEPVDETSLPPKDQTVAKQLNEEAIEALSNKFEAVPKRPEEETPVQKSATEEEIAGFTIPEEPVAESIKTPEQNLLTSEEPTEENMSPCEEAAITERLENTLESVVEAVSELLEVTEKIVEESEDVPAQIKIFETPEQILPISGEPAEEDPSPSEEDANTERLENALESVIAEIKVEEPEDVDVTPVEATEESEPNVSVQEEEEETVVMEDPDEEAPPVVAFLSEPQAKPEVLVVISETTEDGVTQEIVYETDNSVDVPVENSETSDEPVAKCGEAVLETIEEELIAEEAECEAVTSEEVAPDMDALRERLQSACASVVVESAYSLGGLEILTQGYSLTITVHVAPNTEQQ